MGRWRNAVANQAQVGARVLFSRQDMTRLALGFRNSVMSQQNEPKLELINSRRTVGHHTGAKSATDTTACHNTVMAQVSLTIRSLSGVGPETQPRRGRPSGSVY